MGDRLEVLNARTCVLAQERYGTVDGQSKERQRRRSPYSIECKDGSAAVRFNMASECR